MRQHGQQMLGPRAKLLTGGNARLGDKHDGKCIKMRLLNITAFFFALSSALLLYALNYDTRRLEAEVQTKERQADDARSDIAVLKAERGTLARPDRIDGLARQLGLAPPKTDQFDNGREVSELDTRPANAKGR
jgi:cell division protein FtsL